MVRITLLSLAVVAALSGCQKASGEVAKSDKKPAGAAPLLVAAEDVVTVHRDGMASGTVVTGSIEPERRADLRAEISATVLQVVKENGETVHRGDLLVRLDDTSIRDSLMSAEAAERAASQAFDQAEKAFQRLKTLRASGMASAQQLDDAETRRNNAQSDLVSAKARAVSARQQLQRTEVRAPFDGVVSERKASNGDTAQIGKELIKVIDPDSVRFEGFISADKIGGVAIGQPVSFRINGYGTQEFKGVVKRVDAAADPTTRQVAVLVGFTDKQPRVSGLYAEGRIATGGSQQLMVPEVALVRNGDHPYAWRVQGGAIHKVPLVLGERDARRGDFAVQSGLSDGDSILRNPQDKLTDGAHVEIALSTPAPAAAKKVD